MRVCVGALQVIPLAPLPAREEPYNMPSFALGTQTLTDITSSARNPCQVVCTAGGGWITSLWARVLNWQGC